MWIRKLRCSCGCHFVRYKWRTNKGGTEIYGYTCENQKRVADVKFLQKHGIDTSGYCNVKSICEWKLKMMADKIISELLNDKDDVITETIRLINKCVKEMPQREEEDKSEENKNKIIALKNKKNVLLTYLLDGTITKEAFNIKSVELDEEIKKLEEMPKYQQPKKRFRI